MKDEKKAAQPEAAPERRTTTNWRAFIAANLRPRVIKCQAYRPIQPVDQSCHTVLIPEADRLLSHMEPDHRSGGCFQLTLVETVRPWPGWARLEELGLESADFRCEICNATVPFSPSHIRRHMKPHQGNFKRVLPGGVFNITITKELPPSEEDEAFAENG